MFKKSNEERRTNNELAALPGFFFCPSDDKGLLELTLKERQCMLANQGNYTALLVNTADPMAKTDLLCTLDNSRIPTHRKPDAVFPGTNMVPINLTEVIYLD